MKKIFFITAMIFISMASQAQSPRVDTVAVMLLNRMADVIGDLNSCSFTLNSSFDAVDPDYGLVKHTEKSDVYFSGPDKMLIHAFGDKGHRGFWYNGSQIVYYSFDENNYAIIDAPPDIISAIDSVNKDYGIEFPAADFFYPTFTYDILSQFENILYLGKKICDDKECFQILASNKDMSVQFWISNDAFNLPHKFIIIYKNDGNKQYEATFSNWQLNTEIPASVFEFMPPPKAAEILLMPKN
jgi:hypothetical protein